MKKSIGCSLTVMALLGQANAVDLQKHHHHHHPHPQSLVQTKSKQVDMDDDEGDAYMTESIKEAEEEVHAGKKGIEAQREMFRMAQTDDIEQEENFSVAKADQSLVEDALNSKSSVSFDGSKMVIKDDETVMQDTKKIEQEHHEAIHNALKEVQGTETPDKQKETPKVVVTQKVETPKTAAPVVTAPVVATPVAPVSVVQKKGEDLVPVPGLPQEGGPTKAIKTPYAYPPVPIGLYVPPPRDLVKKTEKSDKKDDDAKDDSATEKKKAAAEKSKESLAETERHKHHKKRKHHHKKHHHHDSDSSSDSSSDSDSDQEEHHEKSKSAEQAPGVVLTPVAPNAPIKPVEAAQKPAEVKAVAAPEIKVVQAPKAAVAAAPSKAGYQKEIPMTTQKAAQVQIQAVQVKSDKKPVEINKVALKDDIDDGPDAEDAEIMKSIAYAESALGQKMSTPKRVAQEGWKPIKYDVEEVQIDHEIINDMIKNPNGTGEKAGKPTISIEDTKAPVAAAPQALAEKDGQGFKGFLARAKVMDDKATATAEAKAKKAAAKEEKLKPHATVQAPGIIKDTKAGPKKSTFSMIADELTSSEELLDLGVKKAQKKHSKKSHKKHHKKQESDSSSSDSD